VLKQGNDDNEQNKSPSFPTRFVRLNPRYEESETIKLIKAELPAESPYPKLVPWLDSESFGKFYCVPGDFRIAQSKAYKQGRLYGQDISSGAAVHHLLKNLDSKTKTTKASPNKESTTSSKPDKEPLRILDLCCAPGLKLCAIADWLEQNHVSSSEQQQGPPVVVGVDLHEERLDVTKNVIRKYHVDAETRGACGASRPERLPRIRLYHGDGTTFDPATKQHRELVFDTKADWEEILHQQQQQDGTKQKRKRHNKSSRARERKRLRLLQQQDEKRVYTTANDPALAHQDEEKQYYDRVLVDAECSTDGSLKHVQKVLKRLETSLETDSGPSTSILTFLQDDRKMEYLVSLQKRLAFNGFRLLRAGGLLLYTTCSLSEEQNEQVVQSLLASHSNANLIPIDLSCLGGSSPLVVEGSLAGTIRFLPNTGGSTANEFYGGGFFMAKIQKAQW